MGGEQVAQTPTTETKIQDESITQEATKVLLLSCDCNSCTHWEVVKLPDNSTHLHCKTCEHRIEMTINLSEKVKWVEGVE